MTKADLVEKVTSLGDLTRRDGEVIVETIFGSVIGALQSGDKIEIRGFGSFRIRQRNPRIGRNPKTGARVEVPAKKVPYFKPSKELRDLVNPDEASKVVVEQAPHPIPFMTGGIGPSALHECRSPPSSARRARARPDAKRTAQRGIACSRLPPESIWVQVRQPATAGDWPRSDPGAGWGLWASAPARVGSETAWGTSCHDRIGIVHLAKQCARVGEL